MCGHGRIREEESGAIRLKTLVGARRFELRTSCSRSKRATRLRYAPILCFLWFASRAALRGKFSICVSVASSIFQNRWSRVYDISMWTSAARGRVRDINVGESAARPRAPPYVKSSVGLAWLKPREEKAVEWPRTEERAS